MTTDTTPFDQTLAEQVTYLLNQYAAVADFEAHDALLNLLDTHDSDDPIVATTVSAGVDYFQAWAGH